MAVYEALLLNTVVPQIQAAQAGDSYVMVVNATTPALRITQTGTGNALEVEDSANPDATPFVVTAAGDVGVGTSSPLARLTVSDSTATNGTMILGNNASYHGKFEYIFTSGELRISQVGGSSLGTTFYTGGSERARITNTGEFQWKPNGSTQAMTLDANGNLGVGETNPTSKLYAKSTTGVIASLDGSSTTTGAIDTGSALLFIGHDGVSARNFAQISGYKENGTSGNYASYLGFNTRANGGSLTERARITSGGEFLVGTTGQVSIEKFNVTTTGDTQAALFKNDTNNRANIVSWVATTSGDPVFNQFYTETSITNRGSISYNRAAGLVAYNTTSDYRAKDILGPVTDTGATIDALKVYNGKMKGATVERPMLIAHEAQAVTPYAVTGEKDAVDEDGKPMYQQMDVSSLVPLLIAEIQSLRARVAQLESKGA